VDLAGDDDDNPPHPPPPPPPPPRQVPQGFPEAQGNVPPPPPPIGVRLRPRFAGDDSSDGDHSPTLAATEAQPAAAVSRSVSPECGADNVDDQDDVHMGPEEAGPASTGSTPAGDAPCGSRAAGLSEANVFPPDPRPKQNTIITACTTTFRLGPRRATDASVDLCSTPRGLTLTNVLFCHVCWGISLVPPPQALQVQEYPSACFVEFCPPQCSRLYGWRV